MLRHLVLVQARSTVGAVSTFPPRRHVCRGFTGLVSGSNSSSGRLLEEAHDFLTT
jgi:hypothetical protein